MDLEAELLAVLNNPSDVWSAVVNNLSSEARTLLLVYASCESPCSLAAWQAAVARVSREAAVNFETALRRLDDTFVTFDRSSEGSIVASYRNPSMDDFCADQLERNVGFAQLIGQSEPSLAQVRRLAALAHARNHHGTPLAHSLTNTFKYPQLHDAFGRDAEILGLRLLELAETMNPSSRAFRQTVRDFVQTIGEASSANSELLSRSRRTVADYISGLRFGTDDGEVYSLLDRHAVGVSKILGSDFASFLGELSDSASSLSHFDTLVNIDERLNVYGPDSMWRDKFIEQQDGFEPHRSHYDDSESAATDSDYYTRVAEHLDLQEINYTGEYAALVEELAIEDRIRQEMRNENGEDWRSSVAADESSPEPSDEMEVEQFDVIDALFESLLASDQLAHTSGAQE